MQSSEKTVSVIKSIFLTVFLVSVIGLFYFSSIDKSEPIDNSEPVFINEWTVTDPTGEVFTAGSTFRNNGPTRGTYTMVSTLPENLSADSILTFIVGGNVSIYVDGELRKDFDDHRDMVLPGGCVKRFYIVVPLKETDSGAEVKIVRSGTTRRGYIYQETMITTDGGLFDYLLAKCGLSFVLAGLILIFSLVIVIISIVMRILYKHRIELLYGAMAILVVAAWLITNSYLYPFVFGHYHLDGILNYLMCLMMPFNLVFYLDALQHGRYRKLMNAVLILGTASLIVWPVLHFTEIFSLPNALLYINLILGIQILVVMGILAAEAVRGNLKEYRYTAIGFSGFLICGLFEIVVLNFLSIIQDDIPMLTGLAFLLALAVIQQIHDLRKISDERQKAVDLSEAKTRFLASMSHEIRTPINSVLGMNEMIIRENKDPVIDEYARSVRSSGKMLLMLVNDVLDFSKIEAGKMEIVKIEFQLSAMLREIMPMLKERADEKKLKLSTVFLNDIPDGLISDEFRIRQILINLINNAIKYTDTGSVTLMIGGDYKESGEFGLRFNIKDTGRGISEEGQKSLFEAFTRADLKKNGNIEGTGLGLAIVKNIVDSMDGKIRVESKFGEGSEFIIDLPVGVYDKTPVPVDFMEHTGSTVKNDAGCDYQAPEARILAVDDNNSNLKIVKLFLKRAGIVPDTCDSGQKAIEMCREKKYDLILLDHMMPEPDGIETLRIIRSDDSTLNKETPAVVLTANAVAGSRQIYMEAGFADYLTKPIEAAVLEQTVKKYLPGDIVYEIMLPASVKNDKPEKTPSPVTPAVTAKAGSLEARLRSVEGLDYETAMAYAGNDEDFMEELLHDIADECEVRIESMKNALAEDNLDLYRREAHSIKGLMATIGLMPFSERAKQHEYAAADSDLEFIKNDCEKFYAEYREICSKLIAK